MSEPEVRLDTNPQTYGGVAQDHEYEYDSGLVALPVASRQSAHKVIRLHGGMGTRRMKWAVSRQGTPPVIPAAVSGTGDTLLGATVVPSLPVENRAAGGYNWTVKGEYVYVQNEPRRAGYDSFPVGAYPYPIAAVNDTVPPAARSYLAAYALDPTREALNTLGDQLVASGTLNEDGTCPWPYLFIPAVFSSTHVINGG